MSNDKVKTAAAIQITIDGNVSEREKQIIQLILKTFHVTLMMPFMMKETEATATQDVRSAARALALVTLTLFANESFPDLKILIDDSDIKAPVGLKAP